MKKVNIDEHSNGYKLNYKDKRLEALMIKLVMKIRHCSRQEAVEELKPRAVGGKPGRISRDEADDSMSISKFFGL